MPHHEAPELLTVRETFSRLTVDELKALLAQVRGPVQASKADHPVGILEDPARVRAAADGQGLPG